MARLQFAMVGSHDYQKLMVWEFLDRLDRNDLNPEILSAYEFKVTGIPLPLTCPYCNESHDLGSLCSHLVQNHLYESRPAVCPGCDLNQTKMLYHIVEAHQSMLKINRGSFLQLPPFDHSVVNAISQHPQLLSEFMNVSRQTPLIRKETSLQTFLDRSETHLQSSLPMEYMLTNISDVLDDFVVASNAEDTLTLSACKEEESKENEESDASLTPEEREQKQERAEFMRELVMSSIFDD